MLDIKILIRRYLISHCTSSNLNFTDLPMNTQLMFELHSRSDVHILLIIWITILTDKITISIIDSFPFDIGIHNFKYLNNPTQ